MNYLPAFSISSFIFLISSTSFLIWPKSLSCSLASYWVLIRLHCFWLHFGCWQSYCIKSFGFAIKFNFVCVVCYCCCVSYRGWLDLHIIDVTFADFIEVFHHLLLSFGVLLLFNFTSNTSSSQIFIIFNIPHWFLNCANIFLISICGCFLFWLFIECIFLFWLHFWELVFME